MNEESPEIGRPDIGVSAAPAEAADDTPLLRIEGVCKNFGAFRAVDRFSLDRNLRHRGRLHKARR